MLLSGNTVFDKIFLEVHMTRKNDVVKGLKGQIIKKENGKSDKKVVVKFDVGNKLGYDGCGTHTHQ